MMLPNVTGFTPGLMLLTSHQRASISSAVAIAPSSSRSPFQQTYFSNSGRPTSSPRPKEIALPARTYRLRASSPAANHPISRRSFRNASIFVGSLSYVDGPAAVGARSERGFIQLGCRISRSLSTLVNVLLSHHCVALTRNGIGERPRLSFALLGKFSAPGILQTWETSPAHSALVAFCSASHSGFASAYGSARSKNRKC